MKMDYQQPNAEVIVFTVPEYLADTPIMSVGDAPNPMNYMFEE